MRASSTSSRMSAAPLMCLPCPDEMQTDFIDVLPKEKGARNQPRPLLSVWVLYEHLTLASLRWCRVRRVLCRHSDNYPARLRGPCSLPVNRAALRGCWRQVGRHYYRMGWHRRRHRQGVVGTQAHLRRSPDAEWGLPTLRREVDGR